MFHSIRLFSLLGAIIFLSFSLSAQTVQEPPSAAHPEWSKPYPPFRIAGNLYYVGTYDLGCYLVATPKGNILINTGLAASALQIRANIEALGFRFSDTKILLTTQAHYDHVGALAAIQRLTGAKVWVNAPDDPVMRDGGSTDYAFGNGVSTFEPVKSDSLLKNGAVIRLDGAELVMLSHPGHTKGSCSYLLKTKDSARAYTVLIANLPTIVIEKAFADVIEYAGIARDYKTTFASLKSIRFDLWVASHASQFNLHQKRSPGDGYQPSRFNDRAGFNKAVADLEKQYNLHLKKR